MPHRYTPIFRKMDHPPRRWTMPASTTSVFSAPSDFQAALRNAGAVSLFITGHGRFLARLTKVELYLLLLAAAEEDLPRIAFLAVPTDMVVVSFPIGDRPAPIYGGARPHKGEIMTLGPGHRLHVRTEGPGHWCAIWLPMQEFAEYFNDVTGSKLTIPSDAQLWPPLADTWPALREPFPGSIEGMSVATLFDVAERELFDGVDHLPPQLCSSGFDPFILMAGGWFRPLDHIADIVIWLGTFWLPPELSHAIADPPSRRVINEGLFHGPVLQRNYRRAVRNDLGIGRCWGAARCPL